MIAPSSETELSVNADTALALQAAVLSQHRFDEAAATFVTCISQLFGFDRACIGFVEDGYARIVAISHGAAVDAKQNLNREIAAAMDEAIDQAATVSYPPPASSPPRVTLCHATLARRQAGAACTIPIAARDAIVGAVTVERAGEQPISDSEVVLCGHLVSLVGPILVLMRENERGWTARARQSLRQVWARLTGPGEPGLKLGAAVITLLLALGWLVPIPYHVTAPARLEGSIQRALVAAADGFVEQVAVRPGDTVKTGQILAQLAQHDLKLEHSKWESELAQQVNASGAALARADRSLMMVNHAKAAEARAQLELIEQQIDRAQIRAPFDGIVISGDLTQSLGAPIRRGEVLMVIAPRERFRLIVEVDERDIVDVRAGAAGRISLAALPAQAFSFHTERVTPLAATREGRHFFEVEGKFDAGAASLRPGLQGVARIEAEARPLVWSLLHRLLTWARLSLWSWGFW
jgi:biotin carboxyl carrier protein